MENMVIWIDELKTFLDVFKPYSTLLGMHAYRTEVAVGTVEVKLLILEGHLDIDERRFSVRDAVFEGIFDECKQ